MPLPYFRKGMKAMRYITLDEAITYFDDQVPNQTSREQKTRWVSEIDERIYEEILRKRFPRSYDTYTITSADVDTDVTVPLTLYDYNAYVNASGTTFQQEQIGKRVTFHVDVLDVGKTFGSYAFNGYDDNTSGETVLLVPSMFKDIYRYWLEKNVDINNREIGAANNAIAAFDTAYEDYYAYINSNNRITEINKINFGGRRRWDETSPI